MILHNVFDEVMGSKTKVKLLRVFSKFPTKEFTELELERIANIPQASVHYAIKDLVANSILTFRRVGHSNIYKLDYTEVLSQKVMDVFNWEAGLLNDLVRDLKESLPKITSAILFGSVARREDRADSDIDLLVICDEKTEDKCRENVKLVEEKYGKIVSFHFIRKINELRNKALIENIKKDSILVKGKPIEELL